LVLGLITLVLFFEQVISKRLHDRLHDNFNEVRKRNSLSYFKPVVPVAIRAQESECTQKGLVTVTIKTDDFPKDILWEIVAVDEPNKKLIACEETHFDYRDDVDDAYYKDFYPEPFCYDSVGTYSKQDYLVGCGKEYQFKIKAWLDGGICCDNGHGYYKVKVDGVVVAEGGSFEDKRGFPEKKSFTVKGRHGTFPTNAPTTHAPTPAPTPSPTLERLPRPPFTGKFTSQRELKIAVKTWVNNKSWAITKYGHISDWDVSEVTSMRCLFSGWGDCTTSRFDGKSDDEMRYKLQSFNEDLSKWNVGRVRDMESMFDEAYEFNSDISKWDVRNVKHCQYMFYGINNFNQNTFDKFNHCGV